jgi:hypothetical protein
MLWGEQLSHQPEGGHFAARGVIACL